MTAPAPTDDQQPQQDNHDTRDAVLAALALFLASVAAIHAVQLPARLIRRIVALGYTRRAVLAASRLTLAPPLTGRRPGGSPTANPTTSTVRQVAVEEPTVRAEYLLAATARLDQADRGAVLAADRGAVFAAALRQERNYLNGHVAAGRKRAAAAAVLDEVAATDGPWLQWCTQRDDRVDPDCKELEGTIFTLDQLPRIDGREVIPGAAHVRCRCYPRGLFPSYGPLPAITNEPTPIDLNLTATSADQRLDLAGWNPTLHPRIPKGMPGAGRFRPGYGLPDRDWIDHSLDNMTRNERRALISYTGSRFIEINHSLRGLRDTSPQTRALIGLIDSALARSPMRAPVTLQRSAAVRDFGVHSLDELPDRVGTLIRQPAYMSTSTDWWWNYPPPTPQRPIRIYVDVPAGIHALGAAYLAPIAGEFAEQHEVLLERGLVYMLDSAHRADDGKWDTRITIVDRAR